MRSSDGERFSQLYLELADAYKKRFMPQNGRLAVFKCSPIRKKMRKSFKTLSELKLEFIHKAWKQEAMAHKTENGDLNAAFILFLFKPDNLV